MNNKKLTRSQKEAVGLLSVGTFLEYFDLMLYVHMAVILNDLFFPKTDPNTAKLLAATAFCLTYVLRPIGGFVIGKIGDTIGRKFTITLTTFIMAFVCIVMATTKTYEEIGITASIIVILCRVLQGFSSLGEIMGAQIYVTEILRNPWRSVSSGIVVFAANLGGAFALIITSMAISGGNWRYAFYMGAGIALVGLFARMRLREASAFVDYKRRMKLKNNIDVQKIQSEKPNKKTLLAFAFTETHNPICFYIAYIFCAEIMKTSFGLTGEQVVTQNLLVAITFASGVLAIAFIAKKVHPIKIAIFTAAIFTVFFPFIPYWLNNVSSLFFLGCIQTLILSFTFSTDGTLDAVQYQYFPISKRFSCVAVTYGVSFAIATALVAYGLIPLIEYFGNYGILFLLVPQVIGYWWAVNHFKKLEVKRGAYHDYPNEDLPGEDTAIREEDFNYEDLGDEYEPFKSDCEYSTKLLNQLKSINKEENKKLNIRLIEKAIVFAKKWHDGQMRKTGDKPFYSHPLDVAGMVAEYMPKTDIIVAAILHDVVEDSDCTVELIENNFNKRIAQIVDRLTKKRFENGKHIKLSLEETLNRLQEVDDNEALFVKEMDRMHNLETIEGLNSEKQRKMAEETNSYFLKFVAIIGDKLGIYGKIHLENKMFKYCRDALKNYGK